MSSPNPYAAPKATLDDVAERKAYGVRLGASLFWRALLLHLCVGMPIAIAMYSETDLVRFKLTFFYLGIAAFLAVSVFVTRSGAVAFLWGRRLDMPASAWRKFHWLLVAYYVALALLNLVFALMTSVETWLQFKLFVPSLSMIAFYALVPRFLSPDRQSQAIDSATP